MEYRAKVKIEVEGEEVEFFVAISYSVRISGGMPVVEVSKTEYAATHTRYRWPFPLWDITNGQQDSALDRAMIRQWKAAAEFEREEQAARDEEVADAHAAL